MLRLFLQHMLFSLDARRALKSLTGGVTERCQVGNAISHCATHITEVTPDVRLLFSRHLLSHPEQKGLVDKARWRRRSWIELFLRARPFSPMEFN